MEDVNRYYPRRISCDGTSDTRQNISQVIKASRVDLPFDTCKKYHYAKEARSRLRP